MQVHMSNQGLPRTYPIIGSFLLSRFGVAESVIHESADMVVSTKNKELKNIQFPKTLKECQQNAAKLAMRNGEKALLLVIVTYLSPYSLNFIRSKLQT